MVTQVSPSALTSLETTLGRRAGHRSSNPLDLVNLGPLIARLEGREEVAVGLVDGPVAVDHPQLSGERIRSLRDRAAGCTDAGCAACFHGTFVAGILSARRGGSAPAICPGCTLVVRPIFAEAPALHGLPSATPQDLADAMLECIAAGARVVNISATLGVTSSRGERVIESALDHACRRGVAVVAAAGNESAIGGSVITRHPWVVPVVGYGLGGRPLTRSNLGAVIGRQGFGAPGERVTSLSAAGGTATSGGTSVAAPFVTGAFALLLSAFPRATAAQARAALVGSAPARRRTVVPPLLDATAAYHALRATHTRR
jgi:subtilisin family serine protease